MPIILVLFFLVYFALKIERKVDFNRILGEWIPEEKKNFIFYSGGKK
jgi:hypothetical protein